MTESNDRPRARLGDQAGHAATHCLVRSATGECGNRPLHHILVQRESGEYVTTSACHLHSAEAIAMDGYIDHHLWTSYRSTCPAPVSVWVESVPGVTPGRCEAPLLDEVDGELAEILQHDGGR